MERWRASTGLRLPFSIEDNPEQQLAAARVARLKDKELADAKNKEWEKQMRDAENDGGMSGGGPEEPLDKARKKKKKRKPQKRKGEKGYVPHVFSNVAGYLGSRDSDVQPEEEAWRALLDQGRAKEEQSGTEKGQATPDGKPA